MIVAAAATVVVGVAAVMRILAGPSLDALAPTLIAAACLCIAGLARRLAPSLAAFSLGVGGLLGAIEVVGLVRAWLVQADAADRGLLIALAGVAGTAATLVAWSFLTGVVGASWRPPRRGLSTLAGVGFVAAAFASAVATAPSAAIAAGPDEVTPFRLASRVMLALGAFALVLGATLVVLPRAEAARRRMRAPGGVSIGTALAAEFAPWLGGGRAEAERARIAADLHAMVLPGLRGAAAATSDAAVSQAVDDVERLMAARHSPVLEQFGLIAALEWLAERTEARAGIEVRLSDESPSDAGRPPVEVERAAFRVALLAVDNAVRHAPGSPIEVSVAVDRDQVALAVEDSGPGFGDTSPTGRGLSDMRAEAASVRGRLSVDRPPSGSGAAVRFRWPA